MKMFNTVTKKYLGLSAVIFIVAAICVYLVLKCWFPTHYFSSYGLIPVIFYVLGICSIMIFDKISRTEKKNFLAAYMGSKVLRVFVSAVILIGVMMGNGLHKVDFLCVYALFYLIALIFETVFFFWYEKREKELKSKIEKA